MQTGGVVSDDWMQAGAKQGIDALHGVAPVPNPSHADGPGSGLGRPYALAATVLTLGVGLALCLSIWQPWSASQRSLLSVAAATAAAAATLPTGLLLISHYRSGGRRSDMDAGLIVLLVGILWLVPARVGPLLSSEIGGSVGSLSLGVAVAVVLLARSAGRGAGLTASEGLARRAGAVVALVGAITVAGTVVQSMVGDAATMIEEAFVAPLLAVGAGITLLAGYRAERWSLTFIGMELLGLQLGELFASQSRDPSSGAWLGACVLALVGAAIGALGALALARASAEATRNELLGASVERVRMLQLQATTEEKLHDLRSGLLSVESFVATLGRPGDPTSGSIDEDPSIELLIAEVSRLRELVSLSRREATVVDLSTELRQIVASRRQVGTRFACLIDDGVGVVGNRGELLEMIQNLLDNARHHAPDALVAVTLRLEDDMARLSVADEGPGFDESLLPLVFERGFSTRATGTGLGLYIVRKTAHDLGGSVAAMNRHGGGAVVLLELPGQRLADPTPLGHHGRGDERG